MIVFEKSPPRGCIAMPMGREAGELKAPGICGSARRSGISKDVRRGGAIALCLVGMLWAGCSRAPTVAEGRVLYEENGCASCHGLSGDGKGLAAPALPFLPTDLRNPALFKMGASETAIARTLAEGISGAGSSVAALHASHHELFMPKFDHLTEHERLAIARYVISFAKGS